MNDIQFDRIKEMIEESQVIVLDPAASLDDLAHCENQIGIQLPFDYRTFLLKLGNGGAIHGWPFYSLSESISTDENDFSVPFPFTGDIQTDEEIEKQLSTGKMDYDLPGAIRIAHYGCTHNDVLVTCGMYAGTVWYDGRGTDAGLIAYRDFKASLESQTKTILGFLDWVEMHLKNEHPMFRNSIG